MRQTAELTLWDSSVSQLSEAYREYQRRKNGGPIRGGSTDQTNGIWSPGVGEVCSCCRQLRVRMERLIRYPETLKTHCKTLRHVAHKYDVSEQALRRYANECKREKGQNNANATL